MSGRYGSGTVQLHETGPPSLLHTVFMAPFRADRGYTVGTNWGEGRLGATM